MTMLKTFPKGGVHPPSNKLSAACPVQGVPLPPEVIIPLGQHIGAPAKAIVKAGDKVKAGQCIAEAGGFVSAPVHSSVSGTVKKVDLFTDASGYKRPAVQIAVEGDEWEESVDRSDTLVTSIDCTPEEVIARIRQAGVVGMGGATFPLHVKLSVPPGKKAEILVVNAAECEPYLTCDHRLMLERPDEIVTGIRLLMHALKVSRAAVGVEANKPDAVDTLRKAAAAYPGIEVVALKTKYPQGGEKQLIKALTGREVPSGALPVDVGAVPANVGTTLAVYEAVQKNKPLIERVMTVTGPSVAHPGNFKVRVGTPLEWVIAQAGGIPEDTGKIISGGPMMGRALVSAAVPVTKGTSGVLLLPQELAVRAPETACIRCARCVSVCPMGLEPYLLSKLAAAGRFDEAESRHVTDCIECGSCSYVCPSARQLLDFIRLGKSTVMKNIRLRANK